MAAAEAAMRAQLKIGRVQATLPRERINPKTPIPTLLARDGELELVDSVWGMPWDGFSWNARDDRLATSQAWKPLAGRNTGHAVHLVSHVYEAMGPEKSKVWHSVTRPSGVLFLPALVQQVDGQLYSTSVTTAGGPVFQRIHPETKATGESREVVILRDAREVEAWLHPESNPDWPALLRPVQEGDVEVTRLPPGYWEGTGQQTLFA